MSFYLLDNHVNVGGGLVPWYTTRQNPLSLIVVHTAESFNDFQPPDLTAENVARYGATTTRASWHHTVDSDSSIVMLPATYTAWHARGYNSRGWGIEYACRATDWDHAPQWWIDSIMRRGAIACGDIARRFNIPIRRVTRAQADAGEKGFISHAELDPDRRTDPGAGFPWHQLFAEILLLRGDTMSLPLRQSDNPANKSEVVYWANLHNWATGDDLPADGIWTDRYTAAFGQYGGDGTVLTGNEAARILRAYVESQNGLSRNTVEKMIDDAIGAAMAEVDDKIATHPHQASVTLT